MIVIDYNTQEIVLGELWQYDYGETLCIQGGDLQKIQEIQFSLSETNSNSITRFGVTKDNVTEVTIPDSVLENSDIKADYCIYVFVYNRTSQTGKTIKKFILSVKSRPKLEHTGGTDENAFGEVIEEVKKYAERAETAEAMTEQHAIEVAEDKITVEQTAQDFALKAQQTLTDVNNTGQTQAERIQQTGENAVESVNTAQNTATKGIETAKNEAVEVVQTEGTKQVQVVQEVAQEIIADRKQIAKNKTDIAELRQTKADIIIESEKGTLISLTDSAEKKIQNLKVFLDSTKKETEVRIYNKNLLKNYSLNNSNLDVKTGTLTCETTKNTRKTKVKIQTWKKNEFIKNLFTFSELGKCKAEIVNDGTFDSIRISFDGDAEEADIQIDLTNIIMLKKYILTFENVELGINEGMISGLMLIVDENVGDYEESKEQSIRIYPNEKNNTLSDLCTYYPITTILNDANAEVEVTYVADTKNYIDKKLKELVTKNMRNTANLLSIMPLSTQAEMIENDTNRILESEVM